MGKVSVKEGIVATSWCQAPLKSVGQNLSMLNKNKIGIMCVFNFSWVESTEILVHETGVR